MSSAAIEYFATLGLPRGKPLAVNTFPSPWEENARLTASDIWLDAITDMAILHESSGEELPEDEDGWEVSKRD